jgi:hypothetical protein
VIDLFVDGSPVVVILNLIGYAACAVWLGVVCVWIGVYVREEVR